MSETPDYRDTVFLPKTDFPMKAGLAQKEPAILARWAEEELYEQIRAARAGRERFILHDGPPYANGDIHIGHAMMKIDQGLHPPLAVADGQGRALHPRLGLPRPADRMEDRGAVSQEEARQGRGPAARVPRRMPRLCRALDRRCSASSSSGSASPATGTIPIGRWISPPRRRSRGAAEVRRGRPALPRRQAGHVVPGREDRARRGRGRI